MASGPLLKTAAAATLLLAGCGEPAPAADPPNILVFLADTLRADRLGCYGGPQQTSPRIDAFARQGIRFAHATAPSPYTSPSHASLFTSMDPAVHGVWNRVLLPSGEPIFPRLAEGSTTLAEALAAAGYQTAAIADGGNVSEARGFAQGFQHFESKFRGARNRVDRALDWLEKCDPSKPFFLFLHTYQTHTPYLPDPVHLEKFADSDYQGPLREAWEGARKKASQGPIRNAIKSIQKEFFRPLLPEEGSPDPDDLEFLRALYDAEIAQMDQEFGRLLDHLVARGLDENTILVFTSDHGEEFWEHGVYGHHQVYEPTVHIPLIWRIPGNLGNRVREDSAGLIDLMPTLLDFASVAHPPRLQGKSLDPLGAEAPPGRVLFSEANWPEAQIAWREDQHKVLLFPDSQRRPEAFDLALDPGEINDLSGSQEASDLLQRAARSLEEWKTACLAAQTELGIQPAVRNLDQLTPSQRAELEALGYIGG
jgi:arylsulfatase A-like enzyme